MMVVLTKDEELTEKLKNKHDMSQFGDVCVWAPQIPCYEQSCNHRDESEGWSCKIQPVDFCFEFRGCRFHISTRRDFEHILSYRITQKFGSDIWSEEHSEVMYHYVFAESKQVSLAEFLVDIESRFVTVRQHIHYV